MTTDLWIIGRSGLLGSAVARARSTVFEARPIPWTDPDAAARTLQEELARFLAHAGPGWAIVWAAGATVIGSPAEDAERETRTIEAFASALAARAADAPDGGVFFFASSASVYAGSDGPPFDERTTPVPLNTYAETKLRHEAVITAHLGGLLPVVLGRISTLYGPGQNLAKQQGLVSRMARQAAVRRPISVFVPLDTLRDYLYVDDAAAMILALVDAARRDPAVDARVRNVVDGSSATVGQIAALIRLVSRRRIGIWQSGSSFSNGHVLDLRMATTFPAETASVQRTPLVAGVSRVYADVLSGVVSTGVID